MAPRFFSFIEIAIILDRHINLLMQCFWTGVCWKHLQVCCRTWNGRIK